MICPNCRADVSDSLKFCENCGTRLVAEPAREPGPRAGSAPSASEAELLALQGQPAGAAEGPLDATTAPIPVQDEGFTYRPHGGAPYDAAQSLADQARRQDRSKTLPTAQQPSELPGSQPYGQPDRPHAAGTAAGSPRSQAGPAGQTPPPAQTQPTAGSPVQAPAKQASSAPFVLSIIALACALLLLFPVSLVLAIIALAMNSGQKKRGEANRNHTATFVMGLISLIMSILAAVFAVLVGGIILAAANSGALDDLDLDDFESGRIAIPSIGVPAVATSAVGTWEIESMSTGGVKLDAGDLEFMTDLGLAPHLKLEEDGTAAIELFGVSGPGTWKDEGEGKLAIEFEGRVLEGSLEDGKLAIADDDDVLVFHLAE